MPAAGPLPPREVVRAYHRRSKHQLHRYAAGPETLDWDAQPDPFRRWAGAPLTLLPLAADGLRARWADLPAGVAPQPVTLRAIAALFELSLGLTAWKQQGPDRWALRANPSSGNLHPTEAYLLARGVAGLADGLYHYAPREHGLELRCAQPADVGAPRLWVGLSSIQWREAWKYGERAFRYCQLDTGHALGSLRYAAAALGWQARALADVAGAELAAWLGLDRRADFGMAEAEEPELLVEVGPPGQAEARPGRWSDSAAWQGHANRLDAHPMYRWPLIAEVAAATQAPRQGPTADSVVEAAPAPDPAVTAATVAMAATLATVAEVGLGAQAAQAAMPDPGSVPARGSLPAAQLIRERRSAQHFDRRATMPAAVFARIQAALRPDAGLPWDAWPHPPRVHAVFYANRVEGQPAGACALPRSTAGAALLDALPLHRLQDHPLLAGALRTLSCHQAIAADACLALSLVAEFDEPLRAAPWRYRQLLQEAGLIGHALYLLAEAEGYRGTGIGCYFDDAVHELLGLAGERLQVLYHFTVGVPIADHRIAFEAPYAHRAA